MGEISPLNTVFDISGPEAEAMWEQAKALETAKFPEDDYDRIRWSENGQWVIRKMGRADKDRYSAELACKELAVNFRLLHKLGLSTVSLANVPTGVPGEIYTVSPFLSGLTPATDEQYDKQR